MADGRITVVALIKAKPGMEEAVMQQAEALLEPTRAEPGCIDYVLHRAEEDASSLMFYENWRSREDLDEHLQKPHLQGFVEKAGPMLAEPLAVTLWRVIE